MSAHTRRKALPLFREVVSRKQLPIATFDIETEPIGSEMKFLDGCIFYGDGDYHHFASAQELMGWIFEHDGFRYYAHNGSGFDFTYLVEHLVDESRRRGCKVEPIVQGQSRIVGIVVSQGRKYKWELRDSLAIIPLSLAEAAKIYAPDVQKLDIGLGDGHVYNPDCATDIEYLHRDVDALYQVLTNFEAKIYSLFGTPIGFTAGSTSLYAWQANIPDGHAYYRLNSYAEPFCRQAYYGGYVYPGKSIEPHFDVDAIDMNAAYAAAMRKGVPCGTPYHVGEYVEGSPGIYRCVAHVPDDVRVPPVPSRDGHGNLRWATGTFQTTITSEEIRFAEGLGCRFTILEGYVWDKLEYPFTAFLERTEQLETEEGGIAKQISKLMRNSLYGKFGSKSVVRRVRFLADADLQEGQEPFIDEDTGAFNPYIAFETEESHARYIMPHWASWITAQQRIALLSLFLQVGIEHVYYGDTDCCVGSHDAIAPLIETGKIVIGNKYGQVKLERHYAIFQSLGPKNYHGFDDAGHYHGKVKGIPRKLLTEEVYRLYASTDFKIPPEIEFDSVTSAYNKLKTPNKPMSVKRKRKLSFIGNSLAWKLSGNSRIIPLHVEENQVHLKTGSG